MHRYTLSMRWEWVVSDTITSSVKSLPTPCSLLVIVLSSSVMQSCTALYKLSCLLSSSLRRWRRAVFRRSKINFMDIRGIGNIKRYYGSLHLPVTRAYNPTFIGLNPPLRCRPLSSGLKGEHRSLKGHYLRCSGLPSKSI